MADTSIKVRDRFIAFHRWPGATGRRAYLATRHRHEFHVEVEAGVDNDDRDIEFHDLKDAVHETVHGWHELDGKSCERVARDLLAVLVEDHPEWDGKLRAAEVWEDGECGARVEL